MRRCTTCVGLWGLHPPMVLTHRRAPSSFGIGMLNWPRRTTLAQSASTARAKLLSVFGKIYQLRRVHVPATAPCAGDQHHYLGTQISSEASRHPPSGSFDLVTGGHPLRTIAKFGYSFPAIRTPLSCHSSYARNHRRRAQHRGRIRACSSIASIQLRVISKRRSSMTLSTVSRPRLGSSWAVRRRRRVRLEKLTPTSRRRCLAAPTGHTMRAQTTSPSGSTNSTPDGGCAG